MKKLKEDELKLLTQFVDLLDKMLALDPAKRPSPKVRLLSSRSPLALTVEADLPFPFRNC